MIHQGKLLEDKKINAFLDKMHKKNVSNDIRQKK